jgi:hypothetical protein
MSQATSHKDAKTSTNSQAHPASSVASAAH